MNGIGYKNFKNIVRLHEEEGRTYKSITAEYGVSKPSISKWCSEFSKEQSRDQALTEVAELRRENGEIKEKLEKAEGNNKKLLAQLNRDYENSSIPSSRSRNRKKISNNREHTGEKPGAQPGHIHHGRRKQEPTQTVNLLRVHRQVSSCTVTILKYFHVFLIP